MWAFTKSILKGLSNINFIVYEPFGFTLYNVIEVKLMFMYNLFVSKYLTFFFEKFKEDLSHTRHACACI